jgi:hypothetical protein
MHVHVVETWKCSRTINMQVLCSARDNKQG